MTAAEFVQAEITRTGKRLYTVAEVVALTIAFIEAKAAAAPFEGWQDTRQDAQEAER